VRRANLLQLAIVVAILSFSISASGQPWSGIIDPTRAIDWSQAGIPGGIPSRSTICATLNPGATSAQINSAIAACPSGQVVFLSAGTYTLTSGINFNGHGNVTLRGAGPQQTILQFTGGDSCNGLGGDICVTDSTGFYAGSAPVQPGGSNAHSWTAGYAQGSKQITLDGVTNLSVGQVIILDQANDATDTGGIFVCNSPNTCQLGGAGNSNGRVIGGVTYSQQQLVTITAISGNTVSISPGLYMNNWRASQTPKIWWTSQISQVGIEDMTVDHSASTTAVSGIYLYNCSQCWVTNVRSLNANRNHIWLYQSSRAVIRSNFFYGTQHAASQSYGIEPWITSDDLIENNIFDTVTSPIVSSTAEGIAVAYNFSINNLFTPSAAWMMPTFASHNAGNAMNLYEGNQLNGLYCDDYWGTSNLNTYFRNQLAGFQSGKSLNTNAVVLQSFCRAYNIIGNVLGTAGYHNQYETSPQVLSSNCDTSVFQLGFPQTECGLATPPANDPVVRSSLMRWGNYDTVNASVQWNSAEVPTTAIAFINANPVPASHNLPGSFYLSSKPIWWGGAVPWPAIGPDIANAPGPGGHAFVLPAQACYNKGPFTSGILNFDAGVCYLSPPTNVRVVLH
jgi:hypothetical protein